MGGRTVWCRTPLRLGLAGGGTDLKEFADKEGGRVINATINRFVHVRVSTGTGDEVRFHSYDTGESSTLKESETLGNMPLFRNSLLRILDLSNNIAPPSLVIESFSDSPVGSGLGTSSSLCVGILKALSVWYEIELDQHSLAELAYKVERHDCGFSGGMQDQYSASFGGINDMYFHSDGSVTVSGVDTPHWFLQEFEASIVLYFSGQSRKSSRIIDDQRANILHNDSDAFKALLEMNSQTQSLLVAIESGNLTSLAKNLREGWESKKRTSSAVSTSSIDELISTGYDRGAVSAKVSGAGGGGFILFIVPFEHRNELLTWLRGLDGLVMTCIFTKEGSTAWIQ